MYRWVIACVAVSVLASSGCYYKRPDIEQMYAKVAVGESREGVVKDLGEPTLTQQSEMFYIYDDPEKPVRLRFVLDDKEIVVAKYIESKKDLAKKAEETQGNVPPIQALPGEEPRAYPGGPIGKFQAKPGPETPATPAPPAKP